MATRLPLGVVSLIAGAAALMPLGLAWAGDGSQPGSGTGQTSRAPLATIEDAPLEGPVAWPKATNAAPIYWRAFFTFSTTESLKGVDFSELYESNDQGGYLLTPAEIARLEGTEGVVAIALRAAKVESANWEIDYDLGIEALLPHLGPIRNLARLLCADIRRCVTQDDIEGAVERIEALHAMSRHVRGDGVLISSLVSAAVTNLAVDQTSQFLAQVALTAEQRGRLLTALDAYGTDDPFGVRGAIANEGVWLTAWLAERVREGRLGGQMDMMFMTGPGEDAGLVERIKRMSDRVLIEDLRSCRRYYEDAVAVWGERDAEDRIKAIGALVERGNYGQIARLLAAALDKSYAADQRTRARIERGRTELLSDELAPTQH